MSQTNCNKETSNNERLDAYTDFSEITLNGKHIKKIWWMNIGVPETLDICADHFFPLLKKEQKKTVTATEQTLLYQAEKEDIVILRHVPADAVLADAKRRKGETAHILCSSLSCDSFPDFTEQILADKELMEQLKALLAKASESLVSPAYLLMPFKVTPACKNLADLLQLPLCGVIPPPEIDINDKIISRELCESLGGRVTKGRTCHTKADIENALLAYENENILVVKEFDGVSGQGFYLLKDAKSKKVFETLLKRHKEDAHFRLLIEKWYENSTDLNYQVYVSPDGSLLQTAPSGQLVTDGVYIGTEYDTDTFLSPSMKEDLYAFGKRLGQDLYKKGYYGNLSMDTIICDGTLFHLVEINARLSLSTYFWGALQGLENRSNLIKYYNIPAKDFDLTAFHERFLDQGVFILSVGTDDKSGICRLFLLMSKATREERSVLQSTVETFLLG